MAPASWTAKCFCQEQEAKLLELQKRFIEGACCCEAFKLAQLSTTCMSMIVSAWRRFVEFRLVL